jgi:putative heme-binding domain-containing protein
MEDTDGDNVPDAVRVFAEGLNIPIGVAKVQDAVLAYSIPSIERFQDTDGDGKADKRETLYSSFGYRDTHGMASSFRPWVDGWIYACHGFANDSAVQGSDQKPVQMNSGNTYRFRADGSHIEQWTWGQVNPYGLAFDSFGNLFSSDCHTKPAYQLLRGAYYPSFGKPHDGLGFGPEMMQHLHGSTGIAGIVIASTMHFPKEYRGNLLIGNPVTGRINRDKLVRTGSTSIAEELPDFLSCDDRWFRPVDLAIAPDGSLYIADFYNCIIGHYEVRLDHPRRDRERGRIWRVVYKGTSESPPGKLDSPGDLTRLDADALAKRLGHKNQMVRVHATNQLVERIGPDCLSVVRPILADSAAIAPKVAHALWVVERLAGLSAAEIQNLANHSKPLVRTHLVRALGERPDWTASAPNFHAIIQEMLLKDKNAIVRRVSAEVLGVHPDRSNIEPLVQAWRDATSADTHFVHSLRISLRNNLRDLGGMSEITGSLGEADDVGSRFADIAVGIRNEDAAQFLAKFLAVGRPDNARRQEFHHHAARYLPSNAIADFAAQARRSAGDDEAAQIDIVRGISHGLQERGQAVPADVAGWASELAGRLLTAKNEARCRAGVDLARDLRILSAAVPLENLAHRDSAVPALRYPALEALAPLDAKRATALLIAIVRESDEPSEIRKPAAELLGKIKDPAGTPILSDLLKVASADLAVFLARGLSWSDIGGDALLTAMEEGRAAAELLNDGVVGHELKFRTIRDKDARLANLRQSIPTPDETVRQMMAQRRRAYADHQANTQRGQAVFTKNCGICHQIAGQGAKIGPQLDGVGIRGLDRILEDTLDPDRNVDQAFRRSTILKTDGSVVTGLVLRKEGSVVIVADPQGKEQRVAESDVDEQQTSKLSPMPSDVARALPEADFFDLMAYLLAQQAGPAGK